MVGRASRDLRRPSHAAPGRRPTWQAGGLRDDTGRRPARSRAAAAGDDRRPAGGPRRAGVLRAGRGEVHLRHRRLPARQHRARRDRRRRRACWPAPPTRRPERPPPYCLEGSMAVAGRAVGWLADGLGALRRSRVGGGGGVGGGLWRLCAFVPAFQGLYAPWWDPSARGAIMGLTLHSSGAHVVRATLESLAFQTRAVVDAAEEGAGVEIPMLPDRRRRDGEPRLVQALADVLGRPVERALDAEATVRGAAFAAGLAAGLWDGPESLRDLRGAVEVVEPAWDAGRREAEYATGCGPSSAREAGHGPPSRPIAAPADRLLWTTLSTSGTKGVSLGRHPEGDTPMADDRVAAALCGPAGPRRGRGPCGSQPAGASLRRARPCAAGSRPASSRRTRPRG